MAKQEEIRAFQQYTEVAREEGVVTYSLQYLCGSLEEQLTQVGEPERDAVKDYCRQRETSMRYQTSLRNNINRCIQGFESFGASTEIEEAAKKQSDADRKIEKRLHRIKKIGEEDDIRYGVMVANMHMASINIYEGLQELHVEKFQALKLTNEAFRRLERIVTNGPDDIN